GDGSSGRFADLVRARMRHLTPARRRAVEAAALLGEEVDGDIVRRGVGSDGDGGGEAAVALGLPGLDAGAVRVRAALTRAVVAADMAPGRRVELAAGAGDALLNTARASLARDLHAAALLTDGRQPARALQTLRTAGDRAARAGEIADAEVALRTALALAEVHD